MCAPVQIAPFHFRQSAVITLRAHAHAQQGLRDRVRQSAVITLRAHAQQGLRDRVSQSAVITLRAHAHAQQGLRDRVSQSAVITLRAHAHAQQGLRDRVSQSAVITLRAHAHAQQGLRDRVSLSDRWPKVILQFKKQLVHTHTHTHNLFISSITYFHCFSAFSNCVKTQAHKSVPPYSNKARSTPPTPSITHRSGIHRASYLLLALAQILCLGQDHSM